MIVLLIITISVLQFQYSNFSIKISVLQFQYYNFSITISVLQFQYYNFSITISVVQFQLWKYVKSKNLLMSGDIKEEVRVLRSWILRPVRSRVTHNHENWLIWLSMFWLTKKCQRIVRYQIRKVIFGVVETVLNLKNKTNKK